MVRDESYEIADFIEHEFNTFKKLYKNEIQVEKDKTTYTIEWSTLQDLIYSAVGQLELNILHRADNKENADCYDEIENDVRGILGYRGFDTNFENGDLEYYEYK